MSNTEAQWQRKRFYQNPVNMNNVFTTCSQNNIYLLPQKRYNIDTRKENKANKKEREKRK